MHAVENEAFKDFKNQTSL